MNSTRLRKAVDKLASAMKALMSSPMKPIQIKVITDEKGTERKVLVLDNPPSRRYLKK